MKEKPKSVIQKSAKQIEIGRNQAAQYVLTYLNLYVQTY